ncbi:hypothetical protein XENOCAPTIV_028519 [Xenoophorus captivus]|uniref:Uncharacterized protein n=1 Tax=Xenoophorus captivus TaxID=1517983 RepID=A0ABV0QVD5_9TELE
MDRKESKLTKAEKRAAKKSYEDEKRASVPYSRANSTTDVQAHISAGESIHVIRGSKGFWLVDWSGCHLVRRSMSKILLVTSYVCKAHPRYTSSSSDAIAGRGNESSSLLDMPSSTAGDRGSSQTDDQGRQLCNDLLSSAAEIQRGSKRKRDEGQDNAQTGGKHASVAAHYPGLPMASGGLSFPPMGLNLGNLGHMRQPLVIPGGGSSFLQPRGQTMADLQSMFPSVGTDLLRQPAAGNGHLPPPSSSSAFSSASSSIPMSSTVTSSSLPSAPLPPYLMNPNMAGLLSSSFPLGYNQPLLSAPRMFPNPLLTGSGGFSVPNSNSATPGFLSHFNNPTSSLLGAALTQQDRLPSTVNGGDSSDDDVIEVTGQ